MWDRTSRALYEYSFNLISEKSSLKGLKTILHASHFRANYVNIWSIFIGLFSSSVQLGNYKSCFAGAAIATSYYMNANFLKTLQKIHVLNAWWSSLILHNPRGILKRGVLEYCTRNFTCRSKYEIAFTSKCADNHSYSILCHIHHRITNCFCLTWANTSTRRQVYLSSALLPCVYMMIHMRVNVLYCAVSCIRALLSLAISTPTLQVAASSISTSWIQIHVRAISSNFAGAPPTLAHYTLLLFRAVRCTDSVSVLESPESK